jgi:shikimate kinase
MIVVIGPPGSGKSFLSARYQADGYLVFDNDRLIEALIGELKFYPSVKALAKKMTRSGIQDASHRGLSFVVTISGATQRDRERILSLVGPDYEKQVICLETSAEECLRRCLSDPSRPRTTDWETLIRNWFRRFEPL